MHGLQQCVTANDYKKGKATEGCTSVGTSSLPPGQRPSRKTLAERARCEQSLLSKTHVTFKTYNWKLSEQNCWPTRRYVVTAAIWSDPTYAPLRDALKRPLVNPKVKIAADVNFITVNIRSEALVAGVTD